MPDKYSFAEITKVYVKGEKRYVEGYASTGAVDTDDEIVDPEAAKDAFADYEKWRNVRYMHLPHAIGVIHEWEFDGKGIFVRAEIVDDDIWEKVKKGVLKGFSLGFSKAEKVWDKAKEVWRIVKFNLVEISLVDNPANPECSFTIVKRADVDDAATAAKKEAEMAEEAAAQAAEEKKSVLDTVKSWFESGTPEALEVKALLPEEPRILAAQELKVESPELKVLAAEVEKLKGMVEDQNVEIKMTAAGAKSRAICKDGFIPPCFERPLSQALAGAKMVDLDDAGESQIPVGAFWERLLVAKGTKKLENPAQLANPPEKAEVVKVSLEEAMIVSSGPSDPEGRMKLAKAAKALHKKEKISLEDATVKVLAEYEEKEAA